MDVYLFLIRKGHASDDARMIAARHGAELVNHTDPTGVKRHWFSSADRGEPFNTRRRLAVLRELRTAGLATEELES